MPDLAEVLAGMQAKTGAATQGPCMARTAMPALLSAVQNALAVHKRQIERSGANGWAPHELCSEDEKSWPCPTVKALTDALGASE